MPLADPYSDAPHPLDKDSKRYTWEIKNSTVWDSFAFASTPLVLPSDSWSMIDQLHESSEILDWFSFLVCTLSWKTQAWLDLLWTSLGCVGKAFTPEPQRRVDDWNPADLLPWNWAWIPESFSHKSSMDANIVTGIYIWPVFHQCVTGSMWETKAVLQDNRRYLSITGVFS